MGQLVGLLHPPPKIITVHHSIMTADHDRMLWPVVRPGNPMLIMLPDPMQQPRRLATAATEILKPKLDILLGTRRAVRHGMSPIIVLFRKGV